MNWFLSDQLPTIGILDCKHLISFCWINLRPHLCVVSRQPFSLLSSVVIEGVTSLLQSVRVSEREQMADAHILKVVMYSHIQLVDLNNMLTVIEVMFFIPFDDTVYVQKHNMCGAVLICLYTLACMSVLSRIETVKTIVSCHR